jgi:hypothetical protein
MLYLTILLSYGVYAGETRSHGARKTAAEEPINWRKINHSISVIHVIYLYGDGYPARNKRI